MILYALAIGSPTHPIPREYWQEWDKPVDEYAGYRVVYCNTGSLFVYLQSHAWIDFRDIRDNEIDYWQNSINAVDANRQFCIDNETDFITYSDNQWGLTASLGPWGYKGYGAKPGWPVHDGTISPFAIGGSMPFEPELSIQALWHIYEQYGRKVYGQYGFKDAFNLKESWFADEYLGIDEGLFLIMAENYRTGLVWNIFMRLGSIKKWIDLCF